MAETLGETTPYGTQRLLNGTKWNADSVREDLRGYVVEHLEEASQKSDPGILIIGETGFVKKGDRVGRGKMPVHAQQAVECNLSISPSLARPTTPSRRSQRTVDTISGESDPTVCLAAADGGTHTENGGGTGSP